MKINLKILFIILVNIIFLSACNKKGEKVTLPASTGKTAELLVVSEQNTLNGIVGKQIKAVFAQEIELLPQSEPMFNIVTIAPSAFEGMFTKLLNQLYLLNKTYGHNHKLLYKSLLLQIL